MGSTESLRSINYMKNRPKVLIAKVGLDGHDRGVKVVSRALEEAGCEVYYAGLHHTPEAVVDKAIELGVDLLGVSSLCGAHLTIFSAILKLLRQRGSKIRLFGGGIIPEADKKNLKKMGVEMVFGPGTPLKEIADFVRDTCKKKELTKVTTSK
ncbi:MAG: cobalamin B12-binding domain-containing protein [Candidatus Brocadiaceae bacterium]|nr:cobalamin B12-binding domain-containing protein [Candidatus Brocadiaceae bacterium]